MTKQKTKTQPKLKTPVTYYGGKQQMIGTILPLIPPHQTYVEPFFGGGAIFFSKPPSQCEIINDLRGDVVNFYRICKAEFGILRTLIIGTAHSRQIHREAEQVLKNPDCFSEVKRAWAFWVQTNMSFSSMIFGGWAFEKKTGKTSLKINNKRLNFTRQLQNRISRVQIAISVITLLLI